MIPTSSLPSGRTVPPPKWGLTCEQFGQWLAGEIQYAATEGDKLLLRRVKDEWDDVIDKPSVITDEEISYAVVKTWAGIGCLAALAIFLAWVISR